MKNKFLKSMKDVKKTGVNSVVDSLIRSGAAVGTGIGSTLLGNKLSEKIPMIGKIKGPALFGLGMLGEVFLGNSKMKAAAAGISTWGAIETTHMLLPDAQKELLSFDNATVIAPPTTTTNDVPDNANGVTGFGSIEDWNNAYRMAEEAAGQNSSVNGTNGTGENPDLSKIV